MKLMVLSVISAMAAIAQPAAVSAKEMTVQAIQAGSENIRYDRGIPVVEIRSRNGAVQIQPLAMDHGSLAFSVAVFNASNVPATIDTNQITVQSGSQQLAVFTVDQLVGKAKSRARWSQFGIAMLGAIGSAAAASQYNTYRATTVTPYGVYRSSFSGPSLAGQLQADRISSNTSYAVGRISAQLDQTRSALSDGTLQLTSVDPGQSYGGRIVVEKFKLKSLPQRINIVLNWNGERYDFAFQAAERGTPAPAFTSQALPPIEPAREIPAALATPASTVLASAQDVPPQRQTSSVAYPARPAILASRETREYGVADRKGYEAPSVASPKSQTAAKDNSWGLVEVKPQKAYQPDRR